MLGWLGHPVTVAATALLLVNDHVLKAAVPGPVTGKLSDVAGLVVAPALLATLCALVLPRLPARPVAVVAVVTTGLGFGWVKAFPAGAHVASAAWGLILPSRVLADPTDLVALPALAVAWWVWRRTWAEPRTAPPGRAGWTVSGRAVSVVRTVVVFPLAALAVGATTRPSYTADTRALVWHGQVVVGTRWGNPITYASSDAAGFVGTVDGLHWSRLSATDETEVRAGLPRTLITQSCVPDEPAHCFRVVPGHLRVDESTDSGAHWRTAWGLSDLRRDFLARQYQDIDPIADNVSSAEVAVLGVPHGYLVVVANRRDGMVERLPDGTWQRMGVAEPGNLPTPQPLPEQPYDTREERLLGLLAGAVVLFGAVQARLGRRRLRALSLAGLTVFGLGLLNASIVAGYRSTVLLGLSGLLAVLVGLVWWIVTILGDRRLRWWYLLSVLVASLATVFGVALALAAVVHRSSGALDAYEAPVAIGATVLGLGAPLTVLILRRVRRGRRERRERRGYSPPPGSVPSP